jgi:hypothetical protein
MGLYFVIVYVYQCCQLHANIFGQIKRKIRQQTVADFLYRRDLSESKVVFCGGNFGRVGNTDVCYN